MEHLPIGQMAKLNYISERALRYYQEKGILSPTHIDNDTGRRYYSVVQSTKLDMVDQLQSIGFSLEEIRQVYEHEDVQYLLDKLKQHLGQIDEARRQLDLAHALTAEFIEGYESFMAAPILDRIYLERLPPRNILKFDVRDPVSLTTAGRLNVYEQWELILRDIKQEMLKRDYPLALFRNVGCFVPERTILEGKPQTEYAFVFVDQSFGECFCDSEVLPGGSYLTLYYEETYEPGKFEDTELRLRRMLEYAEKEQLVLAGDFFDEIICRLPKLSGEGDIFLCKACLRVKRQGHASTHG